MPKLNKELANTVENAEEISGGYEPLKPGKYMASLGQVTANTSANGNPYWNWEFTDLRTLDGEKVSGRQWLVTTLPQDGPMPASYAKGKDKWEQAQALAAGRLKQVFGAFGYTVDSDTDELINEPVRLTIGVDTIRSGPRAGERTNRVNAVEAPTADQLATYNNATMGSGDDEQF